MRIDVRNLTARVVAVENRWEDTPEGRPQSPAYGWWRMHDNYESAEARAS